MSGQEQAVLRIDLTATARVAKPANLAVLLKQTEGGVVIADRQGRIVDANPGVSHFFLLNPLELKGCALGEFMEGFDQVSMGLLWSALDADRIIAVETFAKRRDRSRLGIHLDIDRLFDPATGNQVLALLLRENNPSDQAGAPKPAGPVLQEQCAKLEMAGLVAGQIAHDFNNLLTPLIAYPQLIKREIQPGSVAQEYLDLMERTANDMAAINRQLLLFARRGLQSTPVEFDLHDLVGETLKALKGSMPPEIKVDLGLGHAPLRVKGNREQLIRGLQHLFQNAIDAMGTQGTLTVNASTVYLDQPAVAGFSAKPGEYARLAIIDTGAGIAESIRGKIFDPFFTTKKGTAKRGAGLGLCIVHGIVRDHGGFLDLETMVGRGTTFYVFLPVVHAAPDAKPATTPPAARTESVLVVDDDPTQIDLICRHLSSMGLQNTGVNNGEEALALMEKRRFALVILDMVLESGMDGLETFMAIRKRVPDQRVMLTSGHAESSQRVAMAQQLGAGGYLKKPFTLDRLTTLVNKELSPATAEIEGSARELLRVLVVDDSKMIRNLFSIIIAAEYPQAVIDQAADGDEAVRMFKSDPYQVIVMDLQMQRMTGLESFELIAAICREKGWPEPPVVFCTGFLPPEKLNEILSKGPRNRLLRKPVKAEDLICAVRESL